MKEVLLRVLYVAAALVLSQVPWINHPTVRQGLLWTMLGALAVWLVCSLIEGKMKRLHILTRIFDGIFWLTLLLLRFAGSLT